MGDSSRKSGTNRARRRQAKAWQKVHGGSYTQALRAVEVAKTGLPTDQLGMPVVTLRRGRERLVKVLFGRATHCAHPGCAEPVVARRGDILVVTAEIAHIRSPNAGGPRHDPGFASELVDAEENLLLLCPTHHTLVDKHPELHPVDELLVWKRHQVDQASTDRALSKHEVTQIVEQLELTLTTLTEIQVTVELVGVMKVRSRLTTVPLGDLKDSAPFADDEVERRYVGIKLVNAGLVDTNIDVVGLDLDVQVETPATYVFPDDELVQPSRRLKAKASGTWLADPTTIASGLKEMRRTIGRLPSQMRAYAQLADGTRVEGPWLFIGHLALLANDIAVLPPVTYEALQRFGRLNRTSGNDVSSEAE